MFQPDTTYQVFFEGEEGLRNVQACLEEARWFYNLNEVLLIALVFGDEDVLKGILTAFRAKAERIGAFPGLIQAAVAGASAANQALYLAKEKIPNTTPPDPGGLEMFSGGKSE